jgi:hypothetical protein
MERLMAKQQFDLALKVARQIYDPRKASPVNACWSFPPFPKIAEEPEGTMPDPSMAEMTMDEWQESKANTHAAARANQRAYMIRIVMKYLEILIAVGDEHFRLDTLEAIPYAIQMCGGCAPVWTSANGDSEPSEALVNHIRAYSSFARGMECGSGNGTRVSVLREARKPWDASADIQLTTEHNQDRVLLLSRKPAVGFTQGYDR